MTRNDAEQLNDEADSEFWSYPPGAASLGTQEIPA